MQNPRIFLWLGLLFVLWLNVDAWMKDYTGAPAPTAGPTTPLDGPPATAVPADGTAGSASGTAPGTAPGLADALPEIGGAYVLSTSDRGRFLGVAWGTLDGDKKLELF